MSAIIFPSTLDFLKKLAQNNDRDWFNANKNEYLKAYENVLQFTDELLLLMQQHDHIETASGKKSLMRIYRDTRFSKNKTPYKSHFGGGFRRATKSLRGGYYFQIGPNDSLGAGGFFSPNAEDLLRIRKDVELNHEDWDKLLANPVLKKTFGDLCGEKVLTSPKGFSKDQAGIEILKHKQFYFERNFTDQEVLSADFLNELNQTFKNLRPYFDYMSEVLTTDLDGVPLF